MGLVQSPSGASSAPPQPFARAAGATAAAALRPRLLALRSRLGRQLSILRLHAHLLSDRRFWNERIGAGATAAFDRAGRAIEALSLRALKAAIRTIQWRRVALVASAPFVLPSEFRAAVVRILAYLGAIGAMSLIAAELARQPELTAMVEPRPRPAWIEVDRPWPAFQLSMPGFGEDNSHYSIRRHAKGGGRKDTLSFGELGKTQRFLSFEIYRPGSEIDGFGHAPNDMRELAAEYGRVSGLHSAMPIPSKFGKFHAFEFAVGPFSGYSCVGFIRTTNKPRVQIGGLSCSMKLLVDRSAISCALDRLSLISAGSDPDIARLFAKAELKRSFCGQRDHLLYATPRRPGDVTSSVVTKPRLRGRIAR
ncbi:MAG: hypothetical protein AB7V13_14815 [Pseudorhodoplanes sp.]|uniref:hypothetical protein n=1 Tax=Pseudorhodoplanes sp. TaxID=1934341 RepID=UPI003D10294C